MGSLNGFQDKAPQTDGMLLKRDFGAQWAKQSEKLKNPSAHK